MARQSRRQIAKIPSRGRRAHHTMSSIQANIAASEFVEDLSSDAAPRGSLTIVRSIYPDSAPSFLEIMSLTLVGSLLFAGTILLFSRYGLAVESFGDSSAYESVASAIQRWTFNGLQIKQFWGYPYAVAAVAIVARVSIHTSLLLVSWTSCFVAIALA